MKSMVRKATETAYELQRIPSANFRNLHHSCCYLVILLWPFIEKVHSLLGYMYMPILNSKSLRKKNR